ncbi:transporter [candidate division TA06 bacterium DG_26]|uniref:Probable queuosine precursor transporter n=1 Tax=candidate division TA06 bacterium DG_26 TaxID=1703771 RepID=A0A0S7WLY6_UNCT6|nr:MAG: transporter [candidate division TA06 bacterium DG_26]
MKTPITPLFLVITSVFISSLIVSNIVAVKLVDLWGLTLSAAIVVFPVTYIFGDIVTEVYGYSRARLVIWLGFFSNFLVVVFIKIGEWLPSASVWTHQQAYSTVLGYTPRILVASFVAYLFGEFANSFVLSKLKVLTHGKWLWSRTIGSTVVGQFIDSGIFISVAFVGVVPTSILLRIALSQWLFKVGYEAVATPLTYVMVGALKKREQIDAYDYETNFSPLKLL